MESALQFLSGLNPKTQGRCHRSSRCCHARHYLCRGQYVDWQAAAPDLNSYKCQGYRLLTVEDWALSLEKLRDGLQRARSTKPDLFPEPAWAFSISFVRTTDTNTVGPDQAVFGKLELVRLDKPNN